MTVTEAAPPDLTQIKRRQQQMWSSGDVHAVATMLQPVADTLCEAVDLQAGWRVLDVACGSGNAAIAAARCGCHVVGIDYVPAQLARGRRRAEAEGVVINLIEGDAEAIPYPDGTFDGVVSVFGSMFAPDHDRAAAELKRVCRPGGKIGLATWTPDGFIGEMLKAVCPHVPVRGISSPLLWGTELYVRGLFEDAVDTVNCTERTFTFRFYSAHACVDYFRSYYGPAVKAFEAVGDEGGDALFAELADLVRRHTGTKTGPVAIRAKWLETVAVRSRNRV
jgi:ubiquinone/menaquinone biosynthesis C-methylase UbiE